MRITGRYPAPAASGGAGPRENAAIARLHAILGNERATILLNACQHYAVPQWIGHKKYSFPGQKVSPIIAGDLNDLAFYRVKGEPEELKHLSLPSQVEWIKELFGPKTEMEKFWADQIKKSGTSEIDMPFMEKYLLIPTGSGKIIFISDDHTHAAFAWAMAQEAKVIGKPAALVHIDEHDDNDPVLQPFIRTPLPLLRDVANYAWNSLEISNFIDFAVNTLRAEAGGRLIDPYHIYYVLTKNSGSKKLWESNFLDSDSPTRSMLVDGTFVSLERAEEALTLIRKEGRPIIVDLDLDYFYMFHTPNGPEKVIGMPYEEALQRVIDVARQADFMTIATSPNYFLVIDQEAETRRLLERIINAL